MNKEQQTQQKYLELQMLERRIQQLQQQIQTLQQQILELEQIQLNLTEISKVKKGNLILVPLASGIFAKAKIEDAENLIVNVGAGTAVVKNVDSTNKMMSEQIKESKRVENKLKKELNIRVVEFQRKQQELQSLIN